MSKQLLRAGTSVGANVEEAIGAQSKRDFLAKMSIAYKEARESMYWIRLLRVSNYLTEGEYEDLISDAEELCKIIGASQNTTKRSLGRT